MSTNNGESCLGCLEHCKRTHGKTTQDIGLQSFFIVATSKEDFMKKLVSAIAKMIMSCEENAIRLADPSGKQWKVELSQLPSTLPYIPLFIREYFYKEGNILVFTHVEHALFSFKAFQKDGCLFHVSNSHDKSLKQEFLEEKQKQESCGNKKSERDIHKSDSVEVISNGVSLSGSEESHEQEEAEWQGMFEKKRERVEVDCEKERKKRTKMPEFRVTIKKKNIVNHYLERDGETSDKPVKIQLPNTLKKQLLDDWEFVTRLGKLVKLPRNPTVDDILKRYLEHKTKKESMVPEAVAEMLNGLRSYFDKALPAMLLYKHERQQYNEAVSEINNVAPSAVYGAEHLLRLFVKLPELLAYVNMEEEALAQLQHKLQEFLKFLQKNQSNFFLSNYDGPKVPSEER